MFVSKSMTRTVHTVDPATGALEARRLMMRHKFRHLPVVGEDRKLVGIVTDRDLRSVLPREVYREPDRAAEGAADPAVGEFMTADPLTIRPEHTIEDALLLIQEKRVGAFPVVDETGRLRGILSVRDLLRAFTNVLGIGQPGTLLGILVDEEIGQLQRIVNAITEENISFGSVLVARYWDEGKRAVFPYLLTNNVVRIKQKLRDMGYTLLDPMDWYMDQLPRNE